MKQLKPLICINYVFCSLLMMAPALAEPFLRWQPLNEPGVGGRVDSIGVSPHNPDHVLVGGDILGSRVSLNQGDTWSPTLGWLSYEISDFTWHPDDPEIIWAGSLSGPHVSINGGKTWTVQRRGFPPINSGKYSAPIEKILFDPDSGDLLAFGGDHRQLKSENNVLNYGAVWVSKDGGQQWCLLAQIAENGNIMDASYAGEANSEIYATVWGYGVFYSDDDGATWVNRSQGILTTEDGDIKVSSLAVHPRDSKTAWVTVDSAGIYKTTDGGRSWNLLDQDLPTQRSTFWSIAVGRDGQTLYAGNRNYDHRPGVYKSNDGGTTWEHVFYGTGQLDIRKKPYPGGINPWWVEVDPACPSTVYIGTDNAIYRSVDGGALWQVLTADYTSEGWRGNGFSGLVSRNIQWHPYNFNHVIVQGMDAAKVIQSWDGGINWRIDNPGLPDYSGGHDVAFAPGWIFVVFGQDSDTYELIARSRDEGHSWILLRPPVRPSEAKQVHVDPANPNRLWVVIDQKLWYADNATTTTAPRWSRLEVGPEGNAVGDLEAVPNRGDAFYIATDDGIYYTDNGATFIAVGGPKDAENVALAIAPSAPHNLYAASDRAFWEDYGVWHYNAQTQDWIQVWNDRNVTAWVGDIAVHPTNPDLLAILTNDFPYHDETFATGVWLSRDAGKTWHQENQGLPMLRGDVLKFHPDGQRLIVGLGGGGFYIAELNQPQQGLSGVGLRGTVVVISSLDCLLHRRKQSSEGLGLCDYSLN